MSEASTEISDNPFSALSSREVSWSLLVGSPEESKNGGEGNFGDPEATRIEAGQLHWMKFQDDVVMSVTPPVFARCWKKWFEHAF